MHFCLRFVSILNAFTLFTTCAVPPWSETGLHSQSYIPTKGLTGSSTYLKEEGTALLWHCYLEWIVIKVWRKKKTEGKRSSVLALTTQTHLVKSKNQNPKWKFKSALWQKVSLLRLASTILLLSAKICICGNSNYFLLPLCQVKWIRWCADLPHMLQCWV